MPELTLHFSADAETDLEAMAGHLQKRMSALPSVVTAEAAPQRLRSAGLPEILTVLTYATTAITTTTAFLKAVQELVKAWQNLSAQFPHLHNPTLEVGLRQVPIDQVTEADAREALAAGA